MFLFSKFLLKNNQPTVVGASCNKVLTNVNHLKITRYLQYIDNLIKPSNNYILEQKPRNNGRAGVMPFICSFCVCSFLRGVFSLVKYRTKTKAKTEQRNERHGEKLPKFIKNFKKGNTAKITAML